MPDQDNYPTDEELARIRNWEFVNVQTFAEWFAYIRSCWTYADMGYWTETDAKDNLRKPVHRYHISTGGWSGNEDIIRAMGENRIMWFFTWAMSQRGGHFMFEVPA